MPGIHGGYSCRYSQEPHGSENDKGDMSILYFRYNTYNSSEIRIILFKCVTHEDMYILCTKSG